MCQTHVNPIQFRIIPYNSVQLHSEDHHALPSRGDDSSLKQIQRHAVQTVFTHMLPMKDRVKISKRY